MQFQEQSVSELELEIKPLIHEHWKAIAVNQDKIKLNPDWNEYHRLYIQGRLKAYTVRDEGVLVGYFVVIISKSMHYKDHKFANCDIIYVKPDSRAGMTGYKLIKFVEGQLKNHGVSLIHINTKVHAPFDKLLERMDYTLTERLYGKYIGD